jgi:hypothetical protein
MYTDCVSCDRDLGRNSEIPGFAVGRRLAFDRGTGRLWVICPSCEEWNLALLETRWEAVEACERLATEAEARVSGASIGLAVTRGGLELLRVGGFERDEIANWRYGRVIKRRRRWALGAMGVLAAAVGAVGLWAGRVARSEVVALFVVIVLGTNAWWYYHHVAGALAFGRTSRGTRFLVWGFRFSRVRVDVRATDGEPALIVPGILGTSTFRGRDALEVLARLLARRSWTSLGDADIPEAVDRVSVAERPEVVYAQPRRKRKGKRKKTPLFPVAAPPPTSAWRRLASLSRDGLVLRDLDLVEQLALEMALREEIERLDLAGEAVVALPEWTDADEVGRISDDLLLPERVRAWMRSRGRER